jgi:hypothetical protein
MRTQVLVFLATALFAQQSSEGPAKPTREKTQVDERNKKGNNPDGTPKSGSIQGGEAPAQVKQTAGEQTNRDADANHAQTEGHVSEWAIVWLTFGLVVVGILQFFALRRQANLIGKSITEMQDATKATREAVAAYRQYVDVAVRAADAAKRSAEAAIESNALTKESNAATKEATELTRRSFDTDTSAKAPRS